MNFPVMNEMFAVNFKNDPYQQEVIAGYIKVNIADTM